MTRDAWRGEHEGIRELNLSNCINDVCPWSGKPVKAHSLTRYRGHVVGFCNPDCRDKFDSAAKAFDAAIDERR